MQKFDVFNFSTDELPPRDRVSMWREDFARGVVKMDMEPSGDAPFSSSSRIRILPDLKIWSCEVTACDLTRTKSLAADGEDSLVLAIVKSGRASIIQRGQEVFTGKGEAILWSSEAAGVYRNPGTLDIVTLAFPRESLTRVVADVDTVLLKNIAPSTEALRLLTGYVDFLQRHGSPTEPSLLALSSSHIVDLAALALGSTRDAEHSAKAGGLRAARLQVIKSDIMANLSQPGLSVDVLARRHGISQRYIRALFESQQTSFSEFVREQRLRRAYRMLSMSPHPTEVFRPSHSTLDSVIYRISTTRSDAGSARRRPTSVACHERRRKRGRTCLLRRKSPKTRVGSLEHVAFFDG